MTVKVRLDCLQSVRYVYTHDEPERMRFGNGRGIILRYVTPISDTHSKVDFNAAQLLAFERCYRVVEDDD